LRCADSPFVEYKGYLPQKEFWEYVASSDIFFERCLDEEIGYAALEAGALGVPIAKVTLLPYVRRMDLTKNEAIIAYNCESLLKELIYYFDNISREKNRLVESFDKYILARRTWDTVKGQLLNVLGL
jgi:glycosyltransferase involved in cell wall biosynthesis